MNQVRTCIGCRQLGNRADLLRIVYSQEILSFDLSKTKPGRGCWIHPKNSCFSAAITGNSIPRALRVRVKIQIQENLREQAEKMLEI